MCSPEEVEGGRTRAREEVNNFGVVPLKWKNQTHEEGFEGGSSQPRPERLFYSSFYQSKVFTSIIDFFFLVSEVDANVFEMGGNGPKEGFKKLIEAGAGEIPPPVTLPNIPPPRP